MSVNGCVHIMTDTHWSISVEIHRGIEDPRCEVHDAVDLE
jgi:hypothetical protein